MCDLRKDWNGQERRVLLNGMQSGVAAEMQNCANVL